MQRAVTIMIMILYLWTRYKIGKESEGSDEGCLPCSESGDEPGYSDPRSPFYQVRAPLAQLPYDHHESENGEDEESQADVVVEHVVANDHGLRDVRGKAERRVEFHGESEVDRVEDYRGG